MRNVVGPPWRFSRTPASIDRWTPELGAHNRYVFGDLIGLRPGEIDELMAAQVIH